jgi:hypothetical protein
MYLQHLFQLADPHRLTWVTQMNENANLGIGGPKTVAPSSSGSLCVLTRS